MMDYTDTDALGRLTRRDYVTYGSTIVAGSLLAGCTGESSDDGDEPENRNGSYSVEMEPVGEVEFKEPPKNVFTILVHHADMALALGHADAINAVYLSEYFDELYKMFLNHLDGVSVEWADLDDSWNASKEQLYELDSDVHLADPAYAAGMESLDISDIEEIGENIAPWFGNTLSGQHSDPPDEWADSYQYYTLWEIFEKVAQVFQEEERYQALAQIHTDLISEIESNLPPEDERPRVARIQITPTGPTDGIWAYSMNGPGFNRAHTRPFDVEDAFPDMRIYAQIDMEALVAANPDVILRTPGMGPGENWEEIKNQLKTDSVAQEIPAVKNDRIYPLAVRYGGPIMNLFQLEMCAKELYPDQFGEWPEYDGGPYPEFPESEQLFDYQRVADIIEGEF